MFNERGATLVVFDVVHMVPPDVIVCHLAKSIAVDGHVISGHHPANKREEDRDRKKEGQKIAGKRRVEEEVEEVSTEASKMHRHHGQLLQSRKVQSFPSNRFRHLKMNLKFVINCNLQFFLF